MRRVLVVLGLCLLLSAPAHAAGVAMVSSFGNEDNVVSATISGVPGAALDLTATVGPSAQTLRLQAPDTLFAPDPVPLADEQAAGLLGTAGVPDPGPHGGSLDDCGTGLADVTCSGNGFPWCSVEITGSAGGDTITTRWLAPVPLSYCGADVAAGTGNDTIDTRDGAPSVVDCGAGADTVRADRGDQVAANCESVRRG